MVVVDVAAMNSGAGDCECGVPCWSGVWFEIEGLGYMEISDSDARQHRPPEGWTLSKVDYNVLNSSQIFRYEPVSVPVPRKTFNHLPGATLVAAIGSGVITCGWQFLHAIFVVHGVSA